ncbi:WD repeat-containing protein, partial [Desmophyllum pertusum]
MLRIFFNSRQLIHQDKVELVVSAAQIDTESEAWLVFNQTSQRDVSINRTRPLLVLVSSPSVTPTPEQKAVWDLVLKRVGTESSMYEMGVDMVTGSLLPSHSDVQLSCLTGERIK